MDIGGYEIVCELSIDTQCLMYIDICLCTFPWICWRETLQVLEDLVHEVDVLLVCGI